jgi:cytochrome c biogenesis protein CcdA
VLSQILFGSVAGALSILSPCVLPLIPIVVGTAASRSRAGPVALAGGLALSFTAIGLFVATIGFGMGLDADVFRAVGGVMLVVFGLVLMTPVLQMRVATAAGPVGAWTERCFGGLPGGDGVAPQFAVGLLLGAVWAPCVGPTLGAASLMAARGENLGEVAATMLAFGIGAGLSLVLVGMVSREILMRWRGRLLSVGTGGRVVLGAILVVAGAAFLTGLDKRAEVWLLDHSPAWLTALTTSI